MNRLVYGGARNGRLLGHITLMNGGPSKAEHLAAFDRMAHGAERLAEAEKKREWRRAIREWNENRRIGGIEFARRRALDRAIFE